MTWLLMEFQKIQDMHLVIWILIKADNPSYITLAEASVKLQYIEILCLTDPIDKWLQRCT
jgi:hypothetical protein